MPPAVAAEAPSAAADGQQKKSATVAAPSSALPRTPSIVAGFNPGLNPSPAGLDVVGFYLLCPAAAFAAAAAPLTALAAHAGRELSGRLSSLLLLHIDSVSGELSLRDGGPGAGTAALRPCELKLAKLLDQMVLLQSRCVPPASSRVCPCMRVPRGDGRCLCQPAQWASLWRSHPLSTYIDPLFLAAGVRARCAYSQTHLQGGINRSPLPCFGLSCSDMLLSFYACPARIPPLRLPACRYEVSMQLPVTSGRQELAAAFQAAADGAAAGAQGALGLVDGRLATEGWQLADVPAAADDGSAASTGPIAVELLLQPSSSLAMCTAGGGKAGSGLLRGRAEGGAVGQVSIQGCLDCRACLHRREAAAAAVEAVRLDVRRSLQARMDALLDAAEQQQEAAAAEAEEQQGRPHGGAAAAPLPPPPAHPLFAAAGDSSAPLLVSLPRRAFVAAAAAGGLPYCDYLFEGESTQAVLGRLQLLLPMPGLATAAVECLEQAVGRQAPSLSPSAALPLRAGSGSRGVGALPCSALVVGAGAVAVLALAVGYFSLGGQ